MRQLQQSETNKLLGYPADARLLIINADDLGMCHATNAAIFRSLTEGVVCSTTLMVPCPWALHAMHLLAENPNIPFGVHLTVLCDGADYRWGPLTARDKVPSLVDETGYFYRFERMSDFLAQATLDELEVEFRAQIDAVLAAKLKPTHLDWHAVRIARRPDIFDLMLRLAREYGLALRVRERSFIEKVQHQGLPTNDHDFLDSYGLDTIGKSARYTQLLRDLPVGLNEWAVHPGLAHAELLAIEPAGAAVRQADLDFMVSAQVREVIQQEGITLLSYKPLQEVWQGNRPGLLALPEFRISERVSEGTMQTRRFSADLKAKIPGGHPGLYGVPIVYPGARLPSDPERLAAFSERVHGLPIALDEPLMVEAMYFEPQATLDEHSADHPIVFLVTAGAGNVRIGGPEGETRQLQPGDAVLWPANVDHMVWTEGTPLTAIVVQLAR